MADTYLQVIVNPERWPSQTDAIRAGVEKVAKEVEKQQQQPVAVPMFFGGSSLIRKRKRDKMTPPGPAVPHGHGRRRSRSRDENSGWNVTMMTVRFFSTRQATLSPPFLTYEEASRGIRLSISEKAGELGMCSGIITSGFLAKDVIEIMMILSLWRIQGFSPVGIIIGDFLVLQRVILHIRMGCKYWNRTTTHTLYKCSMCKCTWGGTENYENGDMSDRKISRQTRTYLSDPTLISDLCNWLLL